MNMKRGAMGLCIVSGLALSACGGSSNTGAGGAGGTSARSSSSASSSASGNASSSSGSGGGTGGGGPQSPALSTSDNLSAKRYVAASDRAYVFGAADGTFPPMGWHIH